MQLAPPLRHGVAKPAHQPRQGRAGQRRVRAHDDIDERVDARASSAGVSGAGLVFVNSVGADAGVAADHTQQTAIVHLNQEVRGGAGRPSPVVGHTAVREMRIHLARVDGAAFADELEDRPRAFRAGHRPA